jgi:PAS domain S-box-containing protein
MRDIDEKDRLKKENFVLKQRIRELEAKENSVNCLEYSKIISIISEIICVLDLETYHFTQVNPAFKKLVGMEDDEIYSHKIMDFIHPEDHEKTRKAGLKEIHDGNHIISFENRYRNGDGSYSLLQWTTYPDVDQKKVYATARNITAQREYERKLEFQSQLLDQIDDRITATDLEGNITYANQAELNTFGLEYDELIGSNIQIFGEDESYIRQQEILKLAKENGFWNGKVVNFDKNGDRIIFNSRIRLFYDKSGEPTGLIGISSDITKLENRETALIASEHRFKSIFEQNALGEVFGNSKGVIENTNQEFCDIVRYTKNELLGKELRTFIWKGDRRLIDKLNWKSNNEERETLHTVLRLCHKNNYPVWCRVYLKFEKGINGNPDY